jgi:HSP20 family molecular chaperone IbpA
MTRQTGFSSPLLLGFDDIERALERVSRAASDGYPPYNIEQTGAQNGEPPRIRIVLAVAGFSRDEIDISVDDSELIIVGKQVEDDRRDYLHRGIAARQFKRVFVLADGMEVTGAGLKDGLLSIDLVRPEPDRKVRKIEISQGD